MANRQKNSISCQPTSVNHFNPNISKKLQSIDWFIINPYFHSYLKTLRAANLVKYKKTKQFAICESYFPHYQYFRNWNAHPNFKYKPTREVFITLKEYDRSLTYNKTTDILFQSRNLRTFPNQSYSFLFLFHSRPQTSNRNESRGGLKLSKKFE